jgi:hypothetical protein
MHDRRITHRSNQRAFFQMKLSIEATVAGAVAVAFAVLSMAVIAQEESERGTPTNNPVLSHMTAQEFNNTPSAPLGERSESQLLAQY